MWYMKLITGPKTSKVFAFRRRFVPLFVSSSFAVCVTMVNHRERERERRDGKRERDRERERV